MLLNKNRIYTFAVIFIFFIISSLWAQDVKETETKEPAETEDLPSLSLDAKEISLEVLMNMEIISVSKKSERLMDVPASVYVLTKDDIKRHTPQRLFEVLNLVPGFVIREQTFTTAAYSVRKNLVEDCYTQSVLFLVDNVPVYSPVAASLKFELYDIPLQQLNKIEVIKGPGGTLYGANANLGIVNIYTKTPRESQGLYIDMDANSTNYYSPFINFGFKFADNLHMSIYGKYLTTKGYSKTEIFSKSTVTDPKSGNVSNNPFHNDDDSVIGGSGGFNVEWELNEKLKSLTRLSYLNIQSEIYGCKGAYFSREFELRDHDSYEFVASQRFDLDIRKDQSMFFQTYYRRITESSVHTYTVATDIVSGELQKNIMLFGFNAVSMGLNYRYSLFDISKNNKEIYWTAGDPGNKALYGGFIQDVISIGKSFDVTLGCKTEVWTLISNKPYYSPAIKLAFSPGKNLTFWTSGSRTNSVPALQQTVGQLMAIEMGPNLYLASTTTDDIEPTIYDVYEAGIKTTLIPNVFLDISGYYTKYDGDINAKFDSSAFASSPIASNADPNVLVIPAIEYTNAADGTIIGGEIVAKINIMKNVRSEISYTLLKEERIYRYEGDTPFAIGIDHDPKHHIRLRQYVDFPNIGLFTTIYFAWLSKYKRGEPYDYDMDNPVPAGSNPNESKPNKPGNEFELNISIEKTFLEKKLSVYVYGKNLLTDKHVEYYHYSQDVRYPHEIERYFGGGITYKM